MKKLAKYDWSCEDGRSGSVAIWSNGDVCASAGGTPILVAEAVRFMFKTSTKELKADNYTISWYLDYPCK
jgi:hypothetical protein